jgi:hypothetical protein
MSWLRLASEKPFRYKFHCFPPRALTRDYARGSFRCSRRGIAPPSVKKKNPGIATSSSTGRLPLYISRVVSLLILRFVEPRGMAHGLSS